MPLVLDGGFGYRTPSYSAPASPKPVSKPKSTSAPKRTTSSSSSSGASSYQPPSYSTRTSAPTTSSVPRTVQRPTPTVKAPVAPPPKEKPGPTTSALNQNAYLQKDPTYLAALANIQKQVTMGTADYNTQIDQANQDQTAQMNDFDTQRKTALANMLNDFSARGLDTSSLYSDAQQQYNQQADAQRNSIADAIARRIQASKAGITDLASQGELDRTNAMNAAIARYQQSLVV